VWVFHHQGSRVGSEGGVWGEVAGEMNQRIATVSVLQRRSPERNQIVLWGAVCFAFVPPRCVGGAAAGVVGRA
jgi:hypothetical protein